MDFNNHISLKYAIVYLYTGILRPGASKSCKLKVMESLKVVVVVTLLVLCSWSGEASLSREVASSVAAKWNMSCMLVFGDSTVDAGNNNRLSTDFKANFLPYGQDFIGHRPTGRFCNGRLATDIIGELLGISSSIPAFLDPQLKPQQLKHGVSFASASSGYDELTANYSSVIPFFKQIDYLKHYKIHLTRLVGPVEASNIVKNAVVVISAGTNDFIENYYLYPDRSKQFKMEEYQEYLISLMSNYTKEIHSLGATRFVLVGIPPIGCLPLIKTIANTQNCVTKYNDVAISFNSKLVAELEILKKSLGLKTGYLDVYKIMDDAANNPKKYGFLESSKGCCGSGMIEFGDTCKGQETCKDPSRYMFWDAVHPTERLYRIIADAAIDGLVKGLLN